MDDICVHTHRIEVRATTDRSKHRIEILGATENRGIDPESSYSQMWLVDFLFAKTAYLDIHYFCQFATQVINVNTGAPINIRGIFIRQKEDFHGGIKDGRRPEGKQEKRADAWRVRPLI